MAIAADAQSRDASPTPAPLDPRAAIEAIPREYNFAADILERNLAAGRAKKPAFIDPRGSWTYGQLAERVNRFGRVLRSFGIRREERILLALLDTIDWPTAFLGAIKAGVVPVPVNTLMTEDDYRFMLADSRAKVLVVSEALFPKFADLIASSPDLMHVVVSGDNAHGHRRLEDLLTNAKPDAYTAPTTRDDICFWLYTSGSTGTAEGRGACPRQSAPDRRPLRRRRARPQGERRLLFGGEAVLRLWARQRHDLPDGGRRDHRAFARPPDARKRRRHPAPASGHGVLRGADLLRRASWRAPMRPSVQI